MPRSLSERDSHTLAILSIAPALSVHLRSAVSLSTRSLSYLYGCAVLQVDKAGTFTHAEAARLIGSDERTARSILNNLVAAGYIIQVGGRQYFKAQRLALSPSGWLLVKDAAKRVAGLLSPLSVDKE